MFKSEKEELAFYRELHKNMNAVIYVLNLNPYRIEWIADNAVVKSVLGLNAQQVVEQGDLIVAKLLSNTDYMESVKMAVEKFKDNPNIEWAGVYRVKHIDGTYRWIIYSTATLVKDKNRRHGTSEVVKSLYHTVASDRRPRPMRK